LFPAPATTPELCDKPFAANDYFAPALAAEFANNLQFQIPPR
jgi:hypothetical protein